MPNKNSLISSHKDRAFSVVFVCSGNRGVTPIVSAQAASLIKAGVKVAVLTIQGRGFRGYLSSLPGINRKIRQLAPDVVHAHYSLSGIVASLSTRRPVITSLMGSDLKLSGMLRALTRFFARHFWAVTIVKSREMQTTLAVEDVHVLPNGVDTEIFRPLNKEECRNAIGWDSDRKYVVFAADPARPEKNFSLAKTVIDHLGKPDLELKTVYGINHADMPLYLNAADLVLLTSKWEGSPNIVKEAMACNVPVVSTDVGDIRWLTAGTDGYWLGGHDAEDLASRIRAWQNFNMPVRGRERILSLGLDSIQIAGQLQVLYRQATSD
jgi:teichuronic acid biosynthesis glycosyltransferase TuaC